MLTLATLSDFLPLKKDSLAELIEKKMKLICILARKATVNGTRLSPSDHVVKTVLASLGTAIIARGGANAGKQMANSRQSR